MFSFVFDFSFLFFCYWWHEQEIRSWCFRCLFLLYGLLFRDLFCVWVKKSGNVLSSNNYSTFHSILYSILQSYEGWSKVNCMDHKSKRTTIFFKKYLIKKLFFYIISKQVFTLFISLHEFTNSLLKKLPSNYKIPLACGIFYFVIWMTSDHC